MDLLYFPVVWRQFALVILTQTAALGAVSPADVQRGFDHFYNLEFDQAIAEFRDLAQRDPNAPDLRNHLAQSILYREILRAGALETELVTGGNAFLRRQMRPNPADERDFDSTIDKAMELSKQLLQKNPDDRVGLYNLGISHGLRSNYNFIVRHGWMDALRDATASRKLHSRLTQLDPGNVDARLTQAAHEYVVGSLPWTYRMLGFLTGFSGDKESGIRGLKEVYQKGKNNRVDAAILLATVYRRERKPAEAVPVLVDLIRQYPRNYLLRFELAQMYSDLGDKTQALAAIAEVEKLKRAESAGYEHLPMEKVLYFRATVQFWYGDLDDALKNFLSVTARADDLDLNTGATAWMRLGQTYDLKGQRALALAAYRKGIQYAPGSYRAKESEAYVRSPYHRPKA
jgi:tetratricopeptide (TPR) repeat protein